MTERRTPAHMHVERTLLVLFLTRVAPENEDVFSCKMDTARTGDVDHTIREESNARSRNKRRMVDCSTSKGRNQISSTEEQRALFKSTSAWD